MRLDRNGDGEPMIHVGLTLDELQELILLIDDEEVDERFLSGIRKKLAKKRILFRRALRKDDR